MSSVSTWMACSPPGSENMASTHKGFVAYLGDLSFSVAMTVGGSKANHCSEPEGLTEVGPLHSSVEASESWGSEGSYRQVVVS